MILELFFIMGGSFILSRAFLNFNRQMLPRYYIYDPYNITNSNRYVMSNETYNYIIENNKPPPYTE